MNFYNITCKTDTWEVFANDMDIQKVAYSQEEKNIIDMDKISAEQVTLFRRENSMR